MDKSDQDHRKKKFLLKGEKASLARGDTLLVRGLSRNRVKNYSKRGR